MHALLANACRSSVALIATTALALGQWTQRVSVASNGTQGDADSGVWQVSISADGRFVAFRSSASNLIGGDTNGALDVFVRDRLTGTTERVSVATGGAQGNSDSYAPSISADGRFVAFASTATNLVSGDTNGLDDVFVHDRQSGTTERVSLAAGGTEANNHCYSPSISANGRVVAFWSYASNLVPGDTNGDFDIFVRDLQGGTTERVSVNSGGMQGNAGSYPGSISADGRFIAFWSFASNLAPGDTNGWADILVRDRQNGTTERVSMGTGSTQGNSDSVEPSISADGRFVAFWSDASNFVQNDTNGFKDVFVRDRQSGTTELVSVNSGGGQGNSGSGDHGVSISADGRRVAFSSNASNLVAGDTNGFRDIFLYDRQNGTTDRVSVDSAGAQSDSDSLWTSISADGRFVAFDSSATNLVASDTNGFQDVFLRDGGAHDCNSNGIDDTQDIQSGFSSDCDSDWVPDECDLQSGMATDCNANGVLDSCDIASNPALDLDHNGVLDQCQQAGVPYCFGDGSGHACPCDPGQAGTPGHGCANSSGNGAILSATGTTSVTGDSLQLHVANLPNPTSVLFFQGTIQQNGGQGTFNSDGLLCVNGTGGSLIRLGVHAGQPGSSDYGAGVGNDPLVSVRGVIPAVGGTRYYQAWYRDNASFCTAAPSNFSNGLTIVWGP